MRPTIRSIFGGLALAALMVVSSTALAAAADPSPVPGGPAGGTACKTQRDALKTNGATLDELKAFGDCEIARRITTLDNLTTRIAESKVLTSDHAAHLTNEVRTTKNGLLELKAKIDAETDLEALKAEVRQIVTDFRVYVLVVPKVNLVIGSDRVAAAEDRFADIDAKLSDLIKQAEAAGKDVTDARSHLAKMNAAVDKAVGLTEGIPNAVLPLTPAQYNAGTAGPILNDSRAKLAQARTELRTAVEEAKACRDALRALKGGTPAASPAV